MSAIEQEPESPVKRPREKNSGRSAKVAAVPVPIHV